MKLTTCQIAKLFPLLTAFFFLNSPIAALLFYGSNPTLSSSFSTTSHSHFLSERPHRSGVLVLRADDPARAFSTKSVAASRTVAATAASTTLFSKSIRPTSIQIKSPRNAREVGRQKRQLQQPTILQQQQQLDPPQQHQHPQQQQAHQRQRRQQQQQQQQHQKRGQHHPQRVGVLIPTSLHVDLTHVQQGFQNFLAFFQLNLYNVTVDFLRDVDLSGLIKLLEQPKYTSVIKTLNAGITVDSVEQNTNMDVDTPRQPSQQQQLHSEQEPNRHHYQDSVAKQVLVVEQDSHSSGENGKNRWDDARSFSGHCHQLAEQLAVDFNKTVVLWPCPRMKISSNILPSFEAISLAVQSISTKLNFSQVDIYIGDDNWGLGLAIATNLHVPYRIEIGRTIRDLHLQDKPGKAIIVTAPLNDESTTLMLSTIDLKWTEQARKEGYGSEPRRQHTKILLIDMAGNSLDTQHWFYKYLARIGGSRTKAFAHSTGSPAEMVSSNLLVLTLLNDRHRLFLNAAGLMAKMQNFRTPLNDNYKDPPPFGHRNASLNKLYPYRNLFLLFNTIVTTTTQSATSETSPQYDFVVLDIVRDAQVATYKWRPLLILESDRVSQGDGLNDEGSGSYITHSIHPAYDEWLLVSRVLLWQCGAICWTIAAICVGLLVIIIAGIVAGGIAMRNYFLRKRLSNGPNKIVLSASDFVFPVDSRRVDEGIEAMLCCWLQQLQEFGGPEVDKPDLLKGSIGSLKNLGFVIPGAAAPGSAGAITAAANGKSGSHGTGSLARHNPAHLDMRARYNGDLVQLKEVHINGSAELRTKAMDLLVMAHGLRHENINPLIGWLSDPNRTAMVFDYCSRGSLQDVLIMDEIKLDWSFRLSLLTDLVRGMRYLHSSPLRVHGALTSRNCVVDARWVLKITDYGLNSFYESQGLPPRPRSAKELLWTAPELLRNAKHHQHQHHHQNQHGRIQLGTQLGDVYSFGIIMQEVVVRGEPYCMLSLSPEEIIVKIKKPPPLIRPSVSKGAAPPEAINIMRQCWAEQPDMRPDFNSVYERFKMLNHGRKVNFVDTMFQMLEKYSNNLEELIRERTEQLDIERKKTEQLLNRMLPSSVAEKLKMGLAVDPEEFSDVTIYFSDIVGFTTIAAHCSPVQVVDLLNDLYTIFDATINAYNVYKVETIGDAYMVVSGLPVKIPDHAEQIATMALDLLHQSGRFNVKHLPGVPLQLRIGLHTGPCCAGVVGLTMPRYCLFGDTVNTASRMESTGSSWRIHMSQETRDRLEARGGYDIEPRGLIDIKGKGMMNTFWLLGKKGFEKPLPAPPPVGESHGLDESLIRNSITLKGQANKSRTSTNPSSSQSSSLAGETVEVKVEITPPTNADLAYGANLPNSYSLESNSTNTISPNATLCPEFPGKTTPSSTSPQSRKVSELTPENLLNPNSFNRLPSSTGGSSSRLYKKIEEMMDLSSPYNHYKCLSPSESNLTQFYDGKYLYGSVAGRAGGGQGGGGTCPSMALSGSGCGGGACRFDSKPGSSRLLRRQFSLDRDDQQAKGDQQHHQYSLQATTYSGLVGGCGGGVKSSMLDIPLLHDTNRSPKGTLTRSHKQNSASITQDLEKIEEIPLSPASSQHHSSLDSNLNRSPPSNLEAQSPPLAPLSSPQLSAPTSPAPSRSLNGIYAQNSNSARSYGAVNNNGTHPGEELTLNVEQLLSR
ncbi:uncharacterized protein LOC120451081 isoform X2 [Drosophila santomea]|uniref:uncharacterized protein LOC120451081 isoform X2 n=1 Tax=Drosophila santomea TaxID=129105 RepID=UPI0019536B97|nr:uncharacterized protein LOC120451081 isoform X2 [Drosophila santomea]XP_039490377.1 uncharacterized protein LOC120451081 isoform X2 [Drosophila santomea]XP_039490378.1 uncharacterized protein LOC120451081 isoform X2 [Drosophila santomea]XP_039490380.1 uncharacterized protein LOC120451081 isoform X2 [Drosophila santomea]XP_039490381.1 uncharacterized protein LOC120451081 isoform X2 [Drosophila santomea]